MLCCCLCVVCTACAKPDCDLHGEDRSVDLVKFFNPELKCFSFCFKRHESDEIPVWFSESIRSREKRRATREAQLDNDVQEQWKDRTGGRPWYKMNNPDNIIP